MAVLKLDPRDRYAELDLVEDSTVDAAEHAMPVAVAFMLAPAA